MEDETIYNVKKARITRIEDDSYYQRYNNIPAKDVPLDDMRYLLKMFFNRAAINMGKDSYDAPDSAIESMLEFIYKDFQMLTVMYVGMAIIRGSLGKYGSGRLVPNTVYRWLGEITIEFERLRKHDELKKHNSEKVFDLQRFPVGQAICKKIDWLKSGAINEADWDKIPLKELSERISSGMDSVPELWGVTTKNKEDGRN